MCENVSHAGYTNARSLARMYAATLWPVDGVRLLSDATVAVVSKPETAGKDMVLPVVRGARRGVAGRPGGGRWTAPHCNPAFPPRPADTQVHTMGWGPTGFWGPYAQFSLDGDYWLGPASDPTFATTFCSPGMGGALGLADPTLQLAAAYVPTYYDQSMLMANTAVICAALSAAAVKAQ